MMQGNSYKKHHIPRLLLAAGASGSGKTLITCGLLQALVDRGLSVASFKCGPDYIDPMFHSRVIGTKSRNLDTFFTGKSRTCYLFAQNAGDCDIAVMEGVMGYYDGVGGTTTQASAYELADITDTPVLLIVNSKGMSVSLAAYIKGFLEYKKDSHIQGVIFNQMSPMLYPRMKKLAEEELNIRVYGYVPKVEDCVIESRHLGLVLPEEIPELRQRLRKLATVLEETIDIDGILKLAGSAPCLEAPAGLEEEDVDFGWNIWKETIGQASHASKIPAPRIGLASDEAFCFFYEDNLELLRRMGAQLIPFSPIHDKHLPAGLDGLLLYGGYPELNAKALEENVSMRREIAAAIRQGMPCMAECGGFMYLHEEMEDMEGGFFQMAGIIPGRARRTPKLTRFGYITLEQNKAEGQKQADRPGLSGRGMEKKQDTSGNPALDEGNVPDSEASCGQVASEPGKIPVLGVPDLGQFPAHEFHYFDSDSCGNAFHATKPQSRRGWDCIHGTDRLLAGFPHLYYYAKPAIPKAFLKKCLEYRAKRA